MLFQLLHRTTPKVSQRDYCCAPDFRRPPKFNFISTTVKTAPNFYSKRTTSERCRVLTPNLSSLDRECCRLSSSALETFQVSGCLYIPSSIYGRFLCIPISYFTHCGRSGIIVGHQLGQGLVTRRSAFVIIASRCPYDSVFTAELNSIPLTGITVQARLLSSDFLDPVISVGDSTFDCYNEHPNRECAACSKYSGTPCKDTAKTFGSQRCYCGCW